MKHKIYVYGTLRPKQTPETQTILIQGWMYDLGWFPGIKLPDAPSDDLPCFTAEVIEADDERLKELDRYEGYRPDDPENSLYIRKPYLDGWIYEYNGEVNHSMSVPLGDWLKYAEERV